MSKKFSSNVLNMKFMRQAEVREEEVKQQDSEKKLRDLSEWRTKFSGTIRQNQPKLQAGNSRRLGFSSIRMLSRAAAAPAVGRRVLTQDPEETKDETKSETKSETPRDSDLDALWRDQQETKKSKSKKRPKSDADAPTKKRKSRP